MAKRSAFVVLMGGALVALCMPLGCNAVLGIDEATLKDTAGSGAGPGAGNSMGFYTGSLSCTQTTSACPACITKQCSLSIQNKCEGDPNCRAFMDNYSACLGSSCTDGACFEDLFPPATPVDECYAQCKGECTGSPIYTPCQLYCSCMGANCADKFTDGVTFDSMDDCLTQCNNLSLKSPELVTCRRTHCELARIYPAEPHCDHATGTTFCGASSTSAVHADNCSDLSLDTFACLKDSDCCSGRCDDRRSCAPGQ